MIRTLVAVLGALLASAALAAVDVNKASQAELESIKGIGPSTSSLMVAERKKSAFKDWGDLSTRVKGVGEKNSAKFSAAGLTVNGTSFSASAQPAAAGRASGKKGATAKKAATATGADGAATKG